MDTLLTTYSASPFGILLPLSGIVGELPYLSIGVGYTIPFQMFAAEWIDADKLADRMNNLNLPGIKFRPMHLKPFYAFGKGEHLQGVQVHILDYKKLDFPKSNSTSCKNWPPCIPINPHFAKKMKADSTCSTRYAEVTK